jgi:hypothetical protein
MIAPVTLLVASEQTNKKNQGMNVLHNQSEQYTTKQLRKCLFYAFQDWSFNERFNKYS